MELNELKNIWKAQFDDAETEQQLHQKVLRLASYSRIQSMIGLELKLTVLIELFCYILFLLFLIRFCIKHYLEIEFLIPALLLTIDACFEISWNIYRLTVYYSLNNAIPVVKAQKRLQTLIYQEKFATRMLLIAIPVFLLLFFTVVLKGLLGISLYYFMGYRMFWYIIAGSFVVALILVSILIRFPNKEMQQAHSFLQELAAYEEG